jgi:MinD-like ATPase involved in chromosome partitioning or flagellar assembly
MQQRAAGQPPLPAPEPEPAAPVPRRGLTDMLDKLDRQPTVQVTGLRKWLGLGPKRAVIEQDTDEKWLRSYFPRPILVVVATPKGGAGKTPTSVGLGAAFGMARGGGVVVWDNNELRGTLADRTFSAHRLTVVDLLAMWRTLTDQAGGEEGARARLSQTDVLGVLNYQPHGQFWALGSSQEAGAQITADDFVKVRSILTRFFPVVIVDTGNNEVAANWLEAVHNADVLVVPVKWRKDNIKPALRMIETLEGQGRDVARRCVLVGTNGPGDLMPEVQAEVTQWASDGMRVLEVPTDPHISEGAEIDWERLGQGTRRAYQRVGAVCAEVVRDYFAVGGGR